MESFLIRLLIVIGVVWLAQFLLTQFNIQDPPRNLILVVVVILLIIWLVSGGLALPIG